MKLAVSLLILGASIALSSAVYVPEGNKIQDQVQDGEDVGVYSPKITLYEHSNYSGGYQIYTSSATNLLGFNDETSSIIVASGVWVLYKDSEYRGSQYVVTPDNYPSSSSWGGGNDNISSLRLVCS